MGVRRGAAAGLAVLLSGCLSASEGRGDGDGGPGGDGGAGRDGGPGGDGGTLDPVYVDCPDDPVDYWGGGAGLLDDDDVEDLVLLRDSLEPSLRGVEVRRSSDGARVCAFSPALHLRGVRAADLEGDGGPADLALLAFDDASQRHFLVVSGGLDAPTIIEDVETGVEPGFTVDDPYEMRVVDGPSGWQVLYGGPSAALSDSESAVAPRMHRLRGPSGEAIGRVLDVALEPYDVDDLRAYVATEDALYWYDALAILTTGPIEAQQKLVLGSSFSSAAFGDFELTSDGADGCPDLVATTSDPTPRVAAFDLTCAANAVSTPEAVPYFPEPFGAGQEGVHMRSVRMDGTNAEELIVIGHTISKNLTIDARREVRFDEDPEDAGWECDAAEGDPVRQLCGTNPFTTSILQQVDWVRTIRIDLDGNDLRELVIVGPKGLYGCVERVGTGFIGCGE